MIPFGPGEIPTTSTEATQRMSAAISQIIGAKSGASPAITCDLTSPGEITSLSIDISNTEAAASRAKRPASLQALGDVILRNFQVKGSPARVYGAPVSVNIEGRAIPATWSRDDHGSLWLVPSRTAAEGEDAVAASGQVEVSAATADVENALRSAVSELADANGARLKDLRLRVESAGPRGVLVAVDVVAAKFMMNAKVRAIAEASLDDEMNLRIGNLDLTGDGAAGNMVASFLAPKAAAWRGRQIALGQYVFAGAALRDVQLEVGQQLRLRAQFGQ